MDLSDRIVPFTANRQVIYDLLTRARRFHCSVSSCWELDVERLEAARRRTLVNDRPVGITACLVKATGLLMRRHPRLNHHLFHGLLRKYEVAFAEVACNMVVTRKGPEGERILLPLIIDRADELSVEEIQREIDRHRFSPLEELPQFEALQRVKRMPRLLLRWFSYRARSDHRFYRRYFGTYGLSALSARGASARALHTVANTGSAFLLGGVQDAAKVVDGQVVARRVLNLAVVADHFLLDGLDILEAVTSLRRLLRDPTLLGLTEEGAERGLPPQP